MFGHNIGPDAASIGLMLAQFWHIMACSLSCFFQILEDFLWNWSTGVAPISPLWLIHQGSCVIHMPRGYGRWGAN